MTNFAQTLVQTRCPCNGGVAIVSSILTLGERVRACAGVRELALPG